MKYLKTYENKYPSKMFAEYMYDYYGGNDGVFSDTFNNTLTIDIILKNIETFIKIRRNNFTGDTIDRESYRDYLLVKLGFKKLKDTEYYHLIKDFFTKKELEQAEMLYNANKYNL